MLFRLTVKNVQRSNIVLFFVCVQFLFATHQAKAQCDAFIEGPTVVCPGATNTYIISNLPPGAVVNNVSVGGSGSFGTFLFDNIQTITLQIFETNPSIQLCANYQIGAISCTTCITIVTADENGQNFTLTGPTEVCAGTEVVYTISPAPDQNDDIEFTITNGTLISVIGNEVTVLWDGPDDDGEVCFEYANPCGDDQNFCLEVEVIQPPGNAILSGLPDAVCVGDNFTANVADYGNATILWTSTNTNFTSPNGQVSIEGIFSTAGIAEVCVRLSVGCNNDIILCKSINVQPPPNPSLIFTESCGLEGFLTAVDLRIGSTLLWEQVDGPGTLFFGGTDFFITGFTADAAGIYRVRFTEILGNCTVSKEIIFELFEPLIIEDFRFECTGTSGYKVFFTITGGKPPVRVNGTEALINYESGIIPYGTPYSFRVEDAGLCRVDLNGVEDCPCRNSAGTMDTTLILACDSALVTAVFDSNATLLSTNISRFVLHDGKKDSLGRVLSLSAQPVFRMLPVMTFGKIYYISHVVADSVGGSIRLDDPCLQFSNGQPVVFNRSPEISILGDSEICGSFTTLEAESDSLSSDWFWEYSNAGNQTLVFTGQSTNEIQVETNAAGTFTFVTQASFKGCIGRDSLEFTFNEIPELSRVNHNCNDSTGFFVVEIQLNGGTLPYIINNDTIFSSTYISDSLLSGTTYQFLAEDQNGCVSNVLSGIHQCNCFSDAGQMSADTLRWCASVSEFFGFETFVSQLDSDDFLWYVLYRGNDPLTGSIIDVNSSGIFSFRPTLMTGKVYYISKIVGNPSGNLPDFSDPCLSVSNGQPIIFYPELSPVLLEKTEICGNLLTTSTVSFQTGALQWFNAVYNPAPVVISQADSLRLLVSAPGNYDIVYILQNEACVLEDTVSLQFFPFPEAGNITYTCNATNDQVSVNVEFPGMQNVLINNVLYTSFYNSVFDTSLFPLELSVFNGFGCENKLILNHDCNCISEPGSMASDTLYACGNVEDVQATYLFDGVLSGDTSYYILHTLSGIVVGNVLFESKDGRFTFPQGGQYGEVYYISFVNHQKSFANLTDDPCLVVSPGQPVVFDSIPLISGQILVENCVPKATIDLQASIGNVFWNILDSPGGSVYTLIDSEFISNTRGSYTIEILAIHKRCESREIRNFELFDSPVITEDTMVCVQDSFLVSFDITSGSSPYFVNGLILNNFTFLSQNIAGGDTLDVQVVDSRGCFSDNRSFTKECFCTTIAGNFESDTVFICQGLDFEMPDPVGAFLTAGEGINYKIFIEEGTIRTLYRKTSEKTIRYDDVFLNKMVIVFPVFGLADANGMVDETDPCYTEGLPLYLVWKNQISWTLPENLLLCEPKETEIPLETFGVFPVTAFFTFEGKRDSVNITSALDKWILNIPSLPVVLSVEKLIYDGCFSGEEQILMIESAKTGNFFIENPIFVADTSEIYLEIETDTSPEDIVGVEWIIGSSDSTILTKETQLFLPAGTSGIVDINVTDSNGCVYVLQTDIRLISDANEFVFPNIIQPGSGVNGNFIVEPEEKIRSVSMFSLYDRWGNLQYQKNNINPGENIWQGECIGNICGDGVYVFVIQLADLSGNVITYHGDITIVND